MLTYTYICSVINMCESCFAFKGAYESKPRVGCHSPYILPHPLFLHVTGAAGAGATEQ